MTKDFPPPITNQLPQQHILTHPAAREDKPFLHIAGMSLAHGKLPVLTNIELRVKREEIFCLLGPSGCGKTTLLKAIAGFETPVAGKLYLNGKVISSPQMLVPPADRNINMVFQDLALFPHLSVKANILLSMKHGSRKDQHRRMDALITALKLEHVVNQYPHTISGGEQQRTALARALAPQPALLLLDEPLASQDIELKQKLQVTLRALIKEEKLTALLVTHDQNEAFALSDKIGVIHAHGLEQVGTPYEIYYQPRSRFIADFIGKGVLVNGIIEEGTLNSEFGRIKKFQLVTPPDTAPAPLVNPYRRQSLNVKVLVRPDDVRLDNRSAIRAKIKEATFQGSHFLYSLELHSGTKLLSLMPATYRYNLNEEVGIVFSFQHIVAFAS